MPVFLSTYENKVDKKGRVSVPASFRATLGPQSFSGVVVYRSYKFPALEACGMDRMEALSQSLDDMDVFSDAHEQLGATIFADSRPLIFDSGGRISLPSDFLEHAHINETALFVGSGSIFRIWEPGTFKQYQDKARKDAKEQNLTLRLKLNGSDTS